MAMKQKNAHLQGGSSYREVGGNITTEISPAFLALQVHAEMPAGNNLYRNRGGKKMLIIHFPTY
jgi:hypothetical protein